MKFLLILLALSHPSQAGILTARAKSGKLMPNCAGVYVSLLKQNRRSGLNAAENAALAKAMKESADPAERAAAVFTIVLESRLRLVDPAVAREVRETAQSIQRRYGDTINGMMYSSQALRGYRGYTLVPLELAGSAIEQMVRMHELAHTLQTEYKKSVKYVGRRAGARQKKIEKYFQEADAMTLEWRYLRSIPYEDRQALMAMIKANEKVDPYVKKVFVTALRDAGLPLRYYMDSQHYLGRYSKYAVFGDASDQARMQRQAAMLVSGMMAAIGTGLYAYAHSGK